jgi:hypothetical protein
MKFGRLVSVISLALLAPTVAGAQATPDDTPAIVLIKTYADGRSTHEIVIDQPRSSWTPYFPRIPSWAPPPGTLRVEAVKVVHVLTPDRVRVDVSVLRGSPHQKEDPVETLYVTRERPVRSERLREFGVEPVTFSLAPLKPTVLIPPQVVNKTAGLDVAHIEPVMNPKPGYRLSIRNLTTKPAVMFFLKAYKDSQFSWSKRQEQQDGSAVIEPGDTFVFTAPGSSGSTASDAGWAPPSIDTIELTAVLWDDGTFEGEPGEVEAALLSYIGRRAQLDRVVAMMQRVGESLAAPDAKARLKAHFETLPVRVDSATRAEALARLESVVATPSPNFERMMEAVQAYVRTNVLKDLESAPSASDGFAAWHQEILQQYSAARAKFAGR